MVLVRGRKPDATDLLRDSGLHTLPAAVRIDALTGLARGVLELANHGDVQSLAISGGLSAEMTRWALRTTFESVTPAALTW